MFCKICSKPCAPQFDYCYEHRKTRRKKLTKKKIKKLIQLIKNS